MSVLPRFITRHQIFCKLAVGNQSFGVLCLSVPSRSLYSPILHSLIPLFAIALKYLSTPFADDEL